MKCPPTREIIPTSLLQDPSRIFEQEKMRAYPVLDEVLVDVDIDVDIEGGFPFLVHDNKTPEGGGQGSQPQQSRHKVPRQRLEKFSAGKMQ
jgi:hypothetical protein